MSSIDNELNALGKGLTFATFKAAVDYLSNGRKPTLMSFSKNGVIAAGADVFYNYGLKKKWWPWIK